MAKNSEYELLMKIAGKLDPSFISSIKTTVNSLKTTEGRFKLLQNAGKASFDGLKIGMVAVTGATIAMGKALYDMGSEFDDATDKIRTGTGATGEALEGLMNSAKAVYSQVPSTLDDTSTVIADYNTRLGLTGKNLETLSVKALQVSKALDEDVSTVIENSSKIFKNFGIAEEDMGSSMDYIFKVSQATGIGFNELMQTMQTGGAQLQAMGYTFNESATLLGQFDKAGLDTTVMLVGLKQASQKASKDGFKTTGEAMEAYIKNIKNAKTDTEALSIASEKFGAKGAATFVKAIKDGSLNIKDLQNELENSSESIGSVANDTYDLAEKMDMFKNRMKVALSPIANNVFDGINTTAEKLFPIIEQKIFPLFQQFQPLFDQLLECVEPLLNVATQIIDAIEPALQPIINLVVALVNALEPLLKVVTPLFNMIAKIVGWLANGLAEGISKVAGFLSGNKAEKNESEIIEKTAVNGNKAQRTSITNTNNSNTENKLTTNNNIKNINATSNNTTNNTSEFIKLNDNAQRIPKMAEGGIVDKPTLAMIGEGNEPEAVMPLSKITNDNSNAITYSPVINITGDVSKEKVKEIAQLSFEEFKKFYYRLMNENRRVAFVNV